MNKPLKLTLDTNIQHLSELNQSLITFKFLRSFSYGCRNWNFILISLPNFDINLRKVKDKKYANE